MIAFGPRDDRIRAHIYTVAQGIASASSNGMSSVISRSFSFAIARAWTESKNESLTFPPDKFDKHARQDKRGCRSHCEVRRRAFVLRLDVRRAGGKARRKKSRKNTCAVERMPRDHTDLPDRIAAAIRSVMVQVRIAEPIHSMRPPEHDPKRPWEPTSPDNPWGQSLAGSD